MEEDNIQPSTQAPMLPQSTSEERTWATLCHLSALIGYLIPAGNIIGPLIIWNLQKDKFLLVAVHGKNAVNFQISMTIWIAVGLLLCFMCIGIPIIIVLAITDLVCIIMAAVQASSGKSFKYPLAIQFIK